MLKILIVDDVSFNLRLLEEILKQNLTEFSVVEVVKCLSGATALSQIDETFDLVILDIEMPDMDGFEVARRMKESDATAEIPILFLTATYTSEEFQKRGYAIGAIDYVTKPFDGMTLMNRVKLYLKLGEKNKELEKTHKKIHKLYSYHKREEQSALDKQKRIITNEIKDDSNYIVRTVHKAKDILSGDLYSIFKKDDEIIIFLIDGMGHGVVPSLTVYAMLSNIKGFMEFSKTTDRLMERFLSAAQLLLDETEGLSFTVVSINKKKKLLEYAIGGMYPFYVKLDGKIPKLKTNNLPVMNFTDSINVDRLEFEDFDSIVVFSDGLVESDDSDESLERVSKCLHKSQEEIDSRIEQIKAGTFSDDVSLVYIKNIEDK